MGFRLTALPEAMRDHGVDVVELAGWQTRGIAFPSAPIGGIDHWTVGAAVGELPSAAILTYGRSDLPGPLCNVARGRRTDGRCRAFMVASGKANHAGRGRWPTSSGRVADSNYELFGLEVEYRPYAEPIRDEDLDVDARVHAAAAQVCGYAAADVAGHWEYATPAGRKVDRKTIAGGRLRALVAARTNPSQEDDPMAADPRGTARICMREYLGRSPESYSELDWHAAQILALGLNGYIEWLERQDEAVAWAAKIGAEVRTPDQE